MDLRGRIRRRHSGCNLKNLRRLVQTQLVTIHVAIYRLTAGRLGGRWRQGRFLLLATSGRRSGRPHVRPILFIDHPAGWVISAGNAGSSRHPDWALNLMTNPFASIQIDSSRYLVQAVVASTDERPRLIVELTEAWPPFAEYVHKANRQVPIFLLTPSPANA